MDYDYTAKSTTGETVTGLLEAPSVAEVHRQLREQNLFVVSAKPAGRRRQRGPSRARFWSRKVSKRDLMTLTSQLAIMSRTGVDLASALQNIAEQCPNAALRATLQKVHEDILSGKAVSQALGNCEHVFG